MKVILTKDIKGTGRAHSVVDVKDGHALNLLFPRGLAIAATPSAMKRAEAHAQRADEQRALSSKIVEERLAALAEEKVTFTKKANDKGHLYEAVDAEEIAEKAKLPVDAIRIEKPFKDVGEHEVAVSVGDTFGKFTIVIEAE
jgi:large subunit ribosomal protein L9